MNDLQLTHNDPTRVLHIIDTLGGGGSERLLFDIVRLSDQRQVSHRVATFFPDGYFGPFVYDQPLRELGAYGTAAKLQEKTTIRAHNEEKPERTTTARSGLRFSKSWRKVGQAAGRRLPVLWREYGFTTALRLRGAQRIINEYLRSRPHVIHVHGFYGFRYGVFLKKASGCPLVVTVPAMFSQMAAQGTGWLVKSYQRRHHLVDAFFLDPSYRKALLEIGVPEKKLFDISGTVDLDAVERTKAQGGHHRAQVRARLGIPDNSLIALSVGRLDPSKGHSYTVAALPDILERFPNVHWVVLGAGWKREELERQIRELGIDAHAHLIGFQSEPFQFYAAADLYLITTTMEAENISSLQALAMGLPIVAFDTCRDSDLISRLENGLLVPNMDAHALARAVVQLLSLPDRGRVMGSRGASYARRLSLHNQVKDFVSLYEAISKRSSASLNSHTDATADETERIAVTTSGN